MAGTSVNNGVNVEALLAAREALKDAPEATKFTWRASCKWQNGTHSQTKVQSFFGLGQEQSHKDSDDRDDDEQFDQGESVTPASHGSASDETWGRWI